MKKAFSGHYRPSDEELKALWGKCVFILDSNVLLNLYRYPQQARDDLLRVLKALSERLWVPHQVALEYQEDRLGVIAEQKGRYGEVQEVLKKVQDQLGGQLGQLRGRHALINPDELLRKVAAVFGEFRAELEKLEHQQPNVFDHDRIRDEIDLVLEGRVGEPPRDQAELDAIYAEGERRYERGQPPGYMDKQKSETHLYGDLVFQARYGDLILWKQVIKEAQTRDDFRHIVFVTDDGKED
jgi:hypothetical protein